MGRYGKRTVYCRHCGEAGHNKLGCPKVKEIVKKNPNSYLAESLKRRCSYCGTVGHTKNKCAQYIEYIRLKRIDLLEKRATTCEKYINSGIAPGALIRYEFYNYSNRSWQYCLGLVSNVHWKHITRLHSRAIELTCLSFDANETVSWSSVAEDHSNRIVSPMSKEFADKYNSKMMEETNEKACKEIK